MNKLSLVKINALEKPLYKVEKDYVLKEEKIDTMRRDVSDMKNIFKSWIDVCMISVVCDIHLLCKLWLT